MARINFAKNFAGEIYATQTWVEAKGYATETFVTDKGYATTSYVDGKISGLGNVFELKGLVDTLPDTAEIGDVYLMNETVDGQTLTAEYVYTDKGFEKLGVATSTNNFATTSYVDTTFATKTDVDSTFVKATQFKSGKGATATAGTDDNGNTLTVEAKVSAADGNRLSLTDSGLYVPAIVASDVRGFISVDDTATIDMNYDAGVITGNVKKSAETGNILVLKDDGLFVPDTNTDNYHTFTDSNSIEFTDINFNVTANVKVSKTTGNRLTIQTDGLLVPAISKSEVVDFIDVEDTTTIDMTYTDGVIKGDVKIAKNQGTSNPLEIATGENGGLMVQGVGLKTDTGNTFQVAKNATTVWAAVSALDAVVNQLQGGGEDQEGIISQVTNLRTQVQKNSRNIKTNYENIGKLDATDGKLITDTQTLQDAITATNLDVNGIVTTFNNGALKSKPVTLTGEDGEVSGTMETGQIVFAVLDGNKQVYPDIDYSTGVAVLSADYGELTAPATWTVYYGKVVEMTAPKATVGDLTATSAEIVAIETYQDSELGTTAQS